MSAKCHKQSYCRSPPFESVIQCEVVRRYDFIQRSNFCWLQRKPGVEEQRIVVVCVDRASIKSVVVGVLKTDTRISPRPYWRGTIAKRNIGNLRNKAVAVWTASTSRISGIQRRV